MMALCRRLALGAWLSPPAILQIFNFVSPSGKDLEAMSTGAEPVNALCYVQAIGDSFFELSRCAALSLSLRGLCAIPFLLHTPLPPPPVSCGRAPLQRRYTSP